MSQLSCGDGIFERKCLSESIKKRNKLLHLIEDRVHPRLLWSEVTFAFKRNMANVEAVR